jgi:hypothetical protein
MTDDPQPNNPQQPDEHSPLTVDSIVLVPTPAAPAEGAAFVGIEISKLQIEKLKLTNDALRRDTGHRDTWAKKLFPLCAGWLAAVVVILLLEGFHLFGFHLDNSVLIAFIGTTTADVLGLGYIVVNYLFPKPQ